MKGSLLAVIAVVLGGSAPAGASDLITHLATSDGRGAPVQSPPACQGGLRNDDGSFEGATGYANAVQRGTYVMALHIPPDFQPSRVCLCWTRGPFNSGPDVDFDVVFYANDGFGPDPEGGRGFPGTELGRVTTRAENVPEFNEDGVAMFPVELPPELGAVSGAVFVGAEWEPFIHRQFFLCNDAEVGGTRLRPVHEAWSNVPPEPFWSPVSNLRPTYRALGTVLYGNAVHRGDFECDADRPGCGIQ
jgi:hypothetical protein